MKDYKNYIFDLYGTLIDIHTDEESIKNWKKFSNALSKYKIINPKQLKLDYFYFLNQIEKQNKHKEIDIKDVFIEILKKYNISFNNQIIKEIAYEFRKATRSHLRLYSNVIALLELLKKNNKKIYLLSNAQNLFTIPEIKELDIEKYFDDIFISSDIGYKKPDISFIRSLLKKHKLNKKECIFIGNDLYDDITSANIIGIDSYYIHNKLSSSRKSNSKPTYYQEGTNILKIINKIKKV